MRSIAPSTSAPAVRTPDQRRLRPALPVQDLSEFLDFLCELEEVFGPTVKPRRIDAGDRFLL